MLAGIWIVAIDRHIVRAIVFNESATRSRRAADTNCINCRTNQDRCVRSRASARTIKNCRTGFERVRRNRESNIALMSAGVDGRECIAESLNRIVGPRVPAVAVTTIQHHLGAAGGALRGVAGGTFRE